MNTKMKVLSMKYLKHSFHYKCKAMVEFTFPTFFGKEKKEIKEVIFDYFPDSMGVYLACDIQTGEFLGEKLAIPLKAYFFDNPIKD